MTTLLGILGERPADALVLTWVDEAGRDARRMTVGDLRARAASVAGGLEKAGVEPGEPVALVYPPGPDFLDAYLGTLWAGAVPTPLYPPDPRRADARSDLLHHFSATGGRFALTVSRYDRARRLGSVRAFLAGEQRADLRWIATDRLRAPGPRTPHRATPEDVALIQFTSGSTGRPKGVEITHANLDHQLTINREAFGLGPSCHAVSWVPQYHDLGLISCMISAVYGNGRLWMMSPLTFLQAPHRWMEVVHRVQADLVASPDFGYALVTRKTTAQQRAAWDLSGLRVALTAGEPVRQRTAEAFAEAFAPCGFDPDALCPAYGLAEHTVGATQWGRGFLTVRTHDLQQRRLRPTASSTPASTTVAACGAPASGVELAIVSPEPPHLRLPDGTIGEIWLRSPSVARGYRGLPEESARRFGATLADETGAWLRTGDLGAMHEGQLYVTGRLKDLIIVAGRNLYAEDIEECVRHAHPDIRPGGVAAFAVSDEATEGLGVAVEIRRNQRAPDTAAIAAAIERAVAVRHRLGCAAIVLVPAGALPKTTSGKLRRAEIRERWALGRLGAAAHAIHRGSDSDPGLASSLDDLVIASTDGDRDALLTSLRALAANRLGLPVEAVAIDEPLADQGFDSLRLIELTQVIEEATGTPLPSQVVAATSTVHSLVDHLLGEQAPPTTPRPLQVPPARDARIVIIGAGLGGLTAASTLSEQGYADVTVLEVPDPDLADVDEAALAEPHLAGGVRVRRHTAVFRLSRQGGTHRVETDGGTVWADALILAVGPDIQRRILPDEDPRVPWLSRPMDAQVRSAIARLQGLDHVWMVGRWLVGGTPDQVVAHTRKLIHTQVTPAPRSPAPPVTPPASPDVGPWPLTHAQRHYLDFHRLDPSRPLISMAAITWLNGPSDTDVLARAIEDVLAETGDLRLRLVESADGLRVGLGDPGSLEVLDLREHADAARQALVLSHKLAATPLGPLVDRAAIDVLLMRTARDQHALAVRSNHMFLDGRAIGRLLQRLLDRVRNGTLPQWPTTQPDYLDVPTSPDADAFWRELLAEVPRDPAAPPLAPRPARLVSRPLPVDLGREVLDAAHRTGLGLPILHLAASVLVEAARTERDHLLFNLPVNRRRNTDLHALGCHVINVPLPLRLERDAPLTSLLEAARRRVADVLQHAHVPPGRIHQLAGPLPVTPSVNTLQTASALSRPGLSAQVVPVHSGWAADMLETVAMHDLGSGRLLTMYRYAPDLLDSSAVDRWHARLQTTLAVLVREPDTPARELLGRLTASAGMA